MLRLPGYGRRAKAAGTAPPPAPALPIRSAERRRWSAELAGPELAAMVLHGVGGMGKSVLAAQIAARLPQLDPGYVAASLAGEVTPDTFLAALATAVRRHPLAAARGGAAAQAVAAADQAGLPWAQRLSLLREHILGRVPLLVVLDDFDDNLSLEAGTCTIRDPELIQLLTSWADRPHRGRLLITCRHRFALPGAASPRIGFRHLGPLSRAGAIGLATSLPALGVLGEHDLDLAWRLLGGHPRAMEYLDALLAAEDVRFPDLARRLAGPVPAAAGPSAPDPALRPPPALVGPPAPTELPLPAAETSALAVSGALFAGLFDRISAAAQGLLIQASVYRAPIGRDGLLLPVGQYSPAELASLLDECRPTGLLAAGPGAEPPVFVHRWTAAELGRLLAARQRGAELAGAHQRAAEYWRWRLTCRPQDPHAGREARFHLQRASQLEQQAPAERRPGTRREALVRRMRGRLRPYLVATVAVAVAALLTALASGGRPPPHTRTIPAAAVRAQAASWVPAQVAADAIVACDPAMCAALHARGVAAGNLLELRSESSDPLGSDVVLATPALRAGLLQAQQAP